MPIPGVSGSAVSTDDFATYLNDSTAASSPRAAMILNWAVSLCLTEVQPLPPGADIVVFDVAQRAYANPTANSGDRSAAYYAQDQGLFSEATPGSVGSGLYLTQNNREALRALAGVTSRASSVSMAPNDPPATRCGSPWGFSNVIVQ